MYSWHEDEEFWTVIEPALFNSDRLKMAPGDVESLLKLLQLEPGSRVLDLCSGPGRHAIELARRGFHVTAVDRNPRYLERAREAAKAAGVELEFVKDDMRRFVRSGAFDAVINLYTSFGYFENEAENHRVAENVCKSLKQMGVALFDIQGKETLALKFEERRWSEQDGAHLLQHSKPVDDWAWVQSHWILVRGGMQKEFTVRIRLYAATEFRALLESAGFGRVDVYGTLNGTPYDHRAERLIAVGRPG